MIKKSFLMKSFKFVNRIIKNKIKSIFGFLGFEIRKKSNTKYSKNLNYNLYEDTFINHHPNVNILQFADFGDSKAIGFIEKIHQKQYLLHEFNCPICENNNFLPVANSSEGFKWGICKECGLLQMYNRLTQGDLNDFYNTGEYHTIGMGNIDDEKTFSLEYKVMSIYFVDLLKSLWGGVVEIQFLQ